ncbi:hypothetical protein G6F56_001656 [Rhizopus delemar]|nr:hypothetical protein G6F56_001656 [Rhizopus delemar]
MSQDINYVESITTALQATVNEDNEVDWDLFLSVEKETIINSYCGTHLNVFKGTWKRRFKEVASRLNFRIKKDSGDTNNWRTLIYNELKAKIKKSSKSASTTTSTTVSTTTSTTASTTTSTTASTTVSTKSTKSVRNNSISADDKKIATAYLENLSVDEKWRLKSGRFVEDIVMQAINDSTFEHPCLSYIVDLADPIWPNYFSPEETDEVRTYNFVELPDLQDEIQNCINLYDNNTLETAADYYEFASDQKLKFNDSFEKRWIKESIMNAAGLFEEGELLNTNDFSESDLLHTLWTFVYRAFKKSGIKAKLGERTSVSSALGKNEGRSLEFRERRERKVTGAKVDILFKKITDEVGCTEVGKHDVLVIDNKYLDDGMVKLPRTIRDMLCVLVETSPHKINQLYTIGFLMMGLNLELLIMNVPAGKTVTRITRTKKLPFPNKPKNIRLDFLPLLEVTLMGKALMESLARIIDDRKRKAVELNTAEKATSPRLPFSFVGKSSV